MRRRFESLGGMWRGVTPTMTTERASVSESECRARCPPHYATVRFRGRASPVVVTPRPVVLLLSRTQFMEVYVIPVALTEIETE